jgi:hypothetical protein
MKLNLARPARRRARRGISAALIASALALPVLTGVATPITALGILHPMAPLGNIDCCH